MFGTLPLAALLGVFAGAAGVVWVAGIWLSRATDAIDARLGLGQALGGTILLALATNLPELAITVSAARSGNVEVAIGNILGGIAIQTIVLALLDLVAVGAGPSLTGRATSLVPVLEGLLVVAVLTLTIVGHQLPDSLVFARLTPDTVLIALVWLIGIWLVGKGRAGLPWQLADEQARRQRAKDDGHPRFRLGRAGAIFGAAALATLVAGVVLERSGDVLADRFGMSGVLFGATILAASTAIPEISTGIASVRQGEYELAIGDILGGNAFLPVLFLVAGAIMGRAILPTVQKTDLYLTGLAILLTLVYLWGLLLRPRRRIGRLGLDSLVALLVYALGIAGLLLVARG